MVGFKPQPSKVPSPPSLNFLTGPGSRRHGRESPWPDGISSFPTTPIIDLYASTKTESGWNAVLVGDRKQDVLLLESR